MNFLRLHSLRFRAKLVWFPSNSDANREHNIVSDSLNTEG
jgi:hypothetical protein